jgi:hypothetical protein
MQINAIASMACLLVRALTDQCVNNKVVLSHLRNKFGIQLIYIGWLMFSLLLVSSYRSNLIKTWMSPTPTLYLNRFSELVGIGKQIFTLYKSGSNYYNFEFKGKGGRYGQSPSTQL